MPDGVPFLSGFLIERNCRISHWSSDMRLRFAIVLVAGLVIGFVLNSWLFPRSSSSLGGDTAPKPAAVSLIKGVPYVDHDLAPSTLLSLLGLYKNDGDRLVHPTIITALALDDNEVAAITARLRKVADNWTYVVQVRSSDNSKWQLRFPEYDAKHSLSEIGQWAEKILGYQRAYLFMVLMEHDFCILFLRDDVTIEKKAEFEWVINAGQRGFEFDLRNHQEHSPMMRLKSKCEAR